jgi:hypothetical protein
MNKDKIVRFEVFIAMRMIDDDTGFWRHVDW